MSEANWTLWSRCYSLALVVCSYVDLLGEIYYNFKHWVRSGLILPSLGMDTLAKKAQDMGYLTPAYQLRSYPAKPTG